MEFYDSYSGDFYSYSELNLPEGLVEFEGTYESCFLLSLYQIYDYVQTFMIYCLLFRIVSCLAQRIKTPGFIIHSVSILCGNLLLITILGSSVCLCITYIYTCCIIMICLAKCDRFNGLRGYIMGAICLAIIIAFELFQWNPTIWRRVRGVQMITTMKIISLSFDLDSLKDSEDTSSRDNDIKSEENALRYLGYMFCPANCVIGPWSRYGEYIRITEGNNKIDLGTVTFVMVNFALAFIFAVSSNCLVPALISNTSWIWLIAFRDALGFRCSHYFISCLSQLTMSLSGFAKPGPNYSPYVGYHVVKPLSMELPRSLTEVVVDWNIPTHNWLKRYIFRVVHRKSVVLAIFVTYVVSAMLHGLNFQLASVLLSLGVFTLVEYKLRANIASGLNACVRANPCRNCNHIYQKNSPLTLAVNTMFSGIALVHLAFLGNVFNLSTDSETDDTSFRSVWIVWSQLNFGSYWICLMCLLANIVMETHVQLQR